jgi:hypothetical protein
MQDALTEALEHPVAESPAQLRAIRRARKHGQSRGSDQIPYSFLWGVLGSIVGSWIAYRAYRHFTA